VADGESRLETELRQVRVDVSRLLTLSETESERCPHREAIARAANNTARMGAFEDRVKTCEKEINQLRMEQVRLSALAGLSGGGGMATVGAIVYAIGKAAGWW
jgi:hypothetical protein